MLELLEGDQRFGLLANKVMERSSWLMTELQAVHATWTHWFTALEEEGELEQVILKKKKNRIIAFSTKYFQIGS